MKALQEIHKLFDEVLLELGQASLITNKNFERDDLNNESYQKFWSNKDEDNLDFMFEIFENGVSFHIEKTNEIPEWSYEQITNDSNNFKRVVRAIFNCKSIIEIKGKKSKIKFINDKEIVEFEFVFFNGLGLSFMHQKETKKLNKYFE